MRRRFFMAVVVVSVAVMLFVDGTLKVALALGEYLRPTTVESVFLAQGCDETSEPPPPNLMRIVENQQNLYHLTLQKLIVCRSAHRLRGFEQRFAGIPFGEGSPWRPLSRGCCSSQMGRHVVMEVADPAENGSILVRASLVQNRWDYLQLNWNNLRGSWVWRWTGALFWLYACLIPLCGLGIVKAVHHLLRRSR